MIPPASEPEISIRLYTAGAPVLWSRGEVSIEGDGERVIYSVLNGKSAIILENQAIGLGFHWEQGIESAFEGRMEVVRQPDGTWLTLNRVPLESYIFSVIGSEMNPEAPLEFLKAHAIISRSWAMRQMLRSREEADNTSGHSPAAKPTDDAGITEFIRWEDGSAHAGFDVCSDDHCQRYQGIPSHAARRAREAVNATRGVVLTDSAGLIADARFSKSCGGHTELFSTCWQDTDMPYLPAKEDPWCDISHISKKELTHLLSTCFKGYDRQAGSVSEWTAIVDKKELSSRINKIYGLNPGMILSLEPLHQGPSGRIDRLLVRGSERSVIVGKELAIRRLLDARCLRSSAFDISDSGNTFILTGRGWGHGVGLCQTGAARMALNGMSCAEILDFYYPTTSLTKFYD